MPAILFGSISTVADTSELQRQAFNQAFQDHGLKWSWDREDYRTLLKGSGGEQRITDFASEAGDTVDAASIHHAKSELFQKSLADSSPSPRPGVLETIQAAKTNGYKVALVTTTSRENISSLIESLGPEITTSDFDLITDSSNVDEPKPDKAAYSFALEALEERAEDCVAIEDNLGAVQSATAAGVQCVAFPNQNTAGHDFREADRVVDRLTFDDLQASIPAK